MKRFLQTLASIYIWLMVITVTLLFSTLIIITSFFFRPFDPNRNMANQLAVLWGKTIVALIPFWKLRIQGRGYLRNNCAYVLVANHASLSDIICLYCTGKHFKWVAKESLFQIPFFGWAMSALGYVKLERGKHGSIRDSYEKSLDWLRRNISILIFPEGTRAASGKLGDFKNGAFKLATQTKKPIVPIVLIGTKEIIQRGSALFNLGARPKIKILKPIATDRYTTQNFEELKNLVHSQILKELEDKN